MRTRPPRPAPQRQSASSQRRASDRPVARRAFVASGVVALVGLMLAALWAARSMVLLVFGAVLFAVLLRSLGDLLRRVAPGLSPRTAVVVAAIVLVGLVGLLGVGAAPRIAAQADALATKLPGALASAQAWAQSSPWGRRALDALSGTRLPVAGGIGQISGFVGGAAGVLTNALVLIVGGLYLALDPGLYERGVARLLPRGRRRRAQVVMDRMGEQLQKWLLGQFISMAVVGTLTGIGLALLGMPLALLLGVISFVVCFVPFIGPILAAIPGVLLAFTIGPEMALYALLVYVGVQQVESYFITPFVQQRTVALPPALQMFAPIVGGVLLGFAGTALATPLLVVLLTLVGEVYVGDVLGDRSARRASRAPGADRTGDDVGTTAGADTDDRAADDEAAEV